MSYDFDAKLQNDLDQHLQEQEDEKIDYYNLIENAKQKVQELIDNFDMVDYLLETGEITRVEANIFKGNCSIQIQMKEV